MHYIKLVFNYLYRKYVIPFIIILQNGSEVKAIFKTRIEVFFTYQFVCATNVVIIEINIISLEFKYIMVGLMKYNIEQNTCVEV